MIMQEFEGEEDSCNPDCSMSTDFSFILSPQSSSGADSLGKTKTTFSSMWNNLRYGFQSKFRSKFNFNSPICLHGELYHPKMSDSVNYSDGKLCALHVYEKFKHDFYSRIWLTYRKDFSPLLDTSLTSDVNWGCMIRTGQMILAQAMLLHLLGRNWRWNGSDDCEDSIHRMIITWFGDNPDSSLSPFSIHQFIKLGQKQGRKPGDWFGPASISFIIQSALEKGSKENDFLKDIFCYVANDCGTVYLPDLIEQCTINVEGEDTDWRSVLLLIPVRLGGDRFNSIYSSYVQEFLSLSYCLGIIGGKPRHSLYFIGFQDEKLLFMDPHYCQRTVDVSEDNFPLDTYHCLTPRKCSLASIDPSCAIGFYFNSRRQLEEFVEFYEQVLDRTRQMSDYPIFVLSPEKNLQHELEDTQPEKVLRMNRVLVDSQGNVQKVINSEEFVLL